MNPFFSRPVAASEPPHMHPNTPALLAKHADITITHERIIGFFLDHPYIDPTHFFLSCINKFQDHILDDATTHIVKHDDALGMRDEYTQFLAHKHSLRNIMRTQYKEQTRIVDAMQFAHVHDFIAKKFDLAAATDDAPGPYIECSLCRQYRFPSKKALAAHMRKCKRVHAAAAAATTAAPNNT